MISIDDLKAFGADTDEGLSRCMGMEEFYIKLVKMQLADPNFDRLTEAAAACDPKAGFEAAHALKGVLGNLALTPLLKPVEEITERFRGAEGAVDVSDLMPAYEKALAEFRKLAE